MIENNNFALAPIIKRFVKLNKADVDKELGMSYLCNSETLYLNSAKNFVNNANELSELLNKYYDECNYIKAEEIIHRIKGYSYYIGSQFLYDYSSYLWGLNTKFKLEVGLENNIDPSYPDIIWFKQGTYIISSFNTASSTNNFTITIQGKDKMCALNGEVGGALTSSVDFGTIEEENKNEI